MTRPCPRCGRSSVWTYATVSDGACTRTRAVSGCCYASYRTAPDVHRALFRARRGDEPASDWP